MAQSVRLIMAVAIFLSYCLQFYVPFNFIWPILKHQLPGENAQYYGEYVTRTILVVTTFGVAAALPNLGAVGALSCSTLALIFPPILEIVTFWPDKLGSYRWKLWKDLVLVLFGFVGFVLGTYVSLLNIIKPE